MYLTYFLDDEFPAKIFCAKCRSSNKVKSPPQSEPCVACGCQLETAAVEAKISDILDKIKNVKNQISSGGGRGGGEKSKLYGDFVEQYRRLCDLLDGPNKVLLETFEFHTSLLRFLHEEKSPSS